MLDQDQLDRFFADGFLLVRGFFTDRDLQPAIDDVARMVDAMAGWLHQAGKIGDTYGDADFLHRLALIECAFPETSVLLHYRRTLGAGIADLWSGDKLIAVVRQLIGDDIAGHPIWNLRSKTPQTRRMTVPWHQDTAYLRPGAENTLQPTAWIPLLDVREEHGPIQVVRGGHRTGRVLQHHLEMTVGHAKSWYLYIGEADLPPGEIVTCTMDKGDVLFLNQLIPHRSLENLSDVVRWSLDLRWQDPALPSGEPDNTGLVPMRKAGDPAFRPDWSALIEEANQWISRYARQDPSDQFSIEPSGYWLDRWRNVVPA